MASQWKSVLGGAAAAALLILPAAAGSDWTAGPWQGFDAKEVKIDNIVGRLRVDVKPQSKVSIQISGSKDRVNGVRVRLSGDRLLIRGENVNAVWDWRTWFDFSEHDEDTKSLDVHVVVPKGTGVDVEDLVGNATIGDTEGALKFEAVASDSRIGRVRDAKVSMAGSGTIAMADVMGKLDLEIAGSGKVRAVSAQSVDADIAGSGSADVGAVAGGLKLDIAGSGDFTASKVNGPVDVDIMGAGSVNIPQGVANPLRVDIAGAGNFVFGGEAVDPRVSAFGSGRVKIRSYKGRLKSEGMVDVQIGNEGFPPAPPAAPAPPAPPPAGH